MKQSKYILAEHAGREWVIRTRNPFLVGEVITMAGQITFDLWPQKIVHDLNDQEIDKLTASMARWYYHAKGYPYSQMPHKKGMTAAQSYVGRTRGTERAAKEIPKRIPFAAARPYRG